MFDLFGLENLGNEVEHPVAVAQGDPDEVLGLGGHRSHRAGIQQSKRALDACQGGAQFVGDDRNELVALALKLDTLRHFAEHCQDAVGVAGKVDPVGIGVIHLADVGVFDAATAFAVFGEKLFRFIHQRRVGDVMGFPDGFCLGLFCGPAMFGKGKGVHVDDLKTVRVIEQHRIRHFFEGRGYAALGFAHLLLRDVDAQGQVLYVVVLGVHERHNGVVGQRHAAICPFEMCLA